MPAEYLIESMFMENERVTENIVQGHSRLENNWEKNHVQCCEVFKGSPLAILRAENPLLPVDS